MIRQNFKRFYLLLAAIALPTMILAYLSYSSIQDSLRYTEEHYENSLKESEELLVERINQIEAAWVQNTLEYAFYFRDWHFNPQSWDSKESPNKPSGLLNLLMSNGPRFIYPTTKEINTPDYHSYMSTEELALSNKEYSQPIDLKHLNYRFERMSHDKLSPLDLLFNHLGIIRSLIQLKQENKALQHIRLLETELSWTKDPLNIKTIAWLEEFNIYKNTNANKKKIKLAIELIKYFENHILDVDLVQLNALQTIIDGALVLENLNPSDRNKLYRIYQHLSILEKDLLNYYDTNHDLILNLQMGYPRNKAQCVPYQDKIVLFFPLTLASQPIVGTAIFDKEEILSLYIQSIKSSKTSIGRLNFVLEGQNGIQIQNLPNSTAVPYKRLTLNPTSPFNEVILYRIPPEAIKDNALKRANILYLLISFSFIALIFTAFAGIRTMRKDRLLFQMKSNFLSSVTHELKTPLTSIKMFAEMMEKGRVKNLDKIQELSGLINQESDRLDLLVSDILNYNRLEQGQIVLQKGTLNLGMLSHDLIERLRPLAKHKNIEILSTIEKDVFIWGDQRSVESMLQNLIENAIKYSSKEKEIHIHIYKTPKFSYFKIKDQGPGIAKSETSKIFNAFYRVGDELTRKTKGSGIGLAIVKRVADLHDAYISVDSNIDESINPTGTQFCIQFKGHQHA